VRRSTGSSSHAGNAVAVDGAGNVAVTGSFFQATTFGAGEPNQTTLVPAGSTTDMFIASYTAEGRLRWARAATSPSSASGQGVAIDAQGNATVVGSVIGPLTLGAGQLTQTTLPAISVTDVFVASYDDAGTLRWARRAGGSSNDHGAAVAVGPAGNPVISGWFDGTATFGAGQPNQTHLTSGPTTMFLASYDTAGTLRWARAMVGSPGFGNGGRGVAVGADENIVVTGTFGGSATFGSGEANQTTVVSGGGFDLFVAGYAGSGALRWAGRAGGTGHALGSTAAIDGAGNATVAGAFAASVTFGAGQPNETELDTAQGDVLVASYDPGGLLRWVRQDGGPGMTWGGALAAVDLAGNPVVAGAFQGTLTFGDGAQETSITSTGSFDTFVARYRLEDPAPPPPLTPRTKDDCKKDGWRSLATADGAPFRNQGSCVSSVASAKKK
jgi:hypothetical protein